MEWIYVMNHPIYTRCTKQYLVRGIIDILAGWTLYFSFGFVLSLVVHSFWSLSFTCLYFNAERINTGFYWSRLILLWQWNVKQIKSILCKNYNHGIQYLYLSKHIYIFGLLCYYITCWYRGKVKKRWLISYESIYSHNHLDLPVILLFIYLFMFSVLLIINIVCF